MKQLSIPKSQNTEEIAQLIREKRESLKKSLKKAHRKDFSIRVVAKRVGISPTHLERLEHGERDLSTINIIYGISRELNIPLNQLVKVYLGLSDEEERRCFFVDGGAYHDIDNGRIIKDKSAKLLEKRGYKVTEQEVATKLGCSKSHFNHYKSGRRKFKDIRLLYGLSELFDVPLYVFIRNELGITDDEIARVINLDIRE